MSEKIITPYSFTDDEKEVINKHFKSHTDWSKSVFDNIKINLRNHLRTEQNNLCCYCKRKLSYDIKGADIEHILPKSKYESYTFEPLNLSLSCPGCNTKKGSSEVLLNSTKNYPTNSKNVKIIHAHFDNYSDNIEIRKKIIHVGLTDKGTETIYMCKLHRLYAVLREAKKQKTKKSTVSKVVEEIRTGNKPEVEQLYEILKQKIK